MTDNPLVSIIIPVYNVRPYLEESLDGALAQSYQNLEILVIDDGSDDGSGEICDAYGQKDQRIRVFHQENRGLSAARNTGLDHMTGDLIAFLDPDDVYHPDMVQTMTEVLIQKCADIVVCKSVECRAKGKLYFRVRDNAKNKTRQLTSDESLRALIDGELSLSMWNKIYTKQVWNDLRFPNGYVYEDARVTLRLLEKAERIICTDDILVYHRKHPGSITATFSLKNTQDWFLAKHVLEQYVDENTPGIFSEEQKVRFEESILCSACLMCSEQMKESGQEDKVILDTMRSDLLQKGKMFEGSFHTYKSAFIYYLFKRCPSLLPYVRACYRFGKYLMGKDRIR